MKEEKKITEVVITLDIRKKYFRIMDYDNIDYGGSICGSYADKEDLIRIIGQYIRDYVTTDLRKVSTNNE